MFLPQRGILSRGVLVLVADHLVFHRNVQRPYLNLAPLPFKAVYTNSPMPWTRAELAENQSTLSILHPFPASQPAKTKANPHEGQNDIVVCDDDQHI